MKIITFTILSVLLIVQSYAQTASCCTAEGQFTAFINDPDFVDMHPDPVPFQYFSDQGEMMTYMASDGKEAHAYTIKTEKKSDKYLIVFHEWWGLNDYIKQVSAGFFAELEDVNVIALDLFDGKVAATKQEAKEYANALDAKRVHAMIDGIKEKIGPDAKIGTIGWCLGGGWSLQGTLAMRNESVGCVMYYGMPEQDTNRIKDLEAPVLFILANNDKWITPAVVKTFEKNLQQEGGKITVFAYDADHGFANPSNPQYNKEAGDDAYAHTIQFLKEIFRF